MGGSLLGPGGQDRGYNANLAVDGAFPQAAGTGVGGVQVPSSASGRGR
jgi:hypothetical protein